MSLQKRILAGLLAAMMVIPLAACGDDEQEQQSDVVTVPPTDELGALPDDVNKTIKWMGIYDINPAVGKDRSVALALFEDTCGGKIEYQQTAWDTQFDDLASAVIGNKPPDMFAYSALSFPCHVTKGLYQPIDEIVDFTDPLWADVKESAEQFVLAGDHYVAPINSSASAIMIYNKDFIDEMGSEDPWQLYLEGKWNWNEWESIMNTWVSGAAEGELRYGVNGWFQPQIVQQTGQTMVTLEDGKFTNNLNNADIERAETFIYNLAKNGYVDTNWNGSAKVAMSKGTTLFFSMGGWASTGTNGPGEDANWGVVPIPSDPNNTSGQKYMSGDIFSFMWVKGSTAKEAMEAWFKCNRIAETDEEYKAVGKEKFFADNPYWTEEMYEAMQAASDPEALKIFDYAFGISSAMSDESAAEGGMSVTKKLYEYVNSSDEDGTQYTWAQVRDMFSAFVDTELAAVNAAVAEMNG